MLSSSELRLASELLKKASEEFSNHGCNDFEWPEWFPKEERVTFCRAMEMDNSKDPVLAEETVEMYAYKKHSPPDWWLMAYLSRKLGDRPERPNPWVKVSENPPPMDEMVLLSWHGLEGSAVGYRYCNDEAEEDYYNVGGDTCDGDDPEYWMPIPEIL